jgi:formate dehydrogenase major subunit
MEPRVPITIDGIATEGGPEETILSVARGLGIAIPTLCYLDGKEHLESCAICMVEVEGQRNVLPSCASKITPGMVVRTDTPALRESRKLTLELLLSDHLGDCVAPCELACPADIDIPEFLRLIRDGRYKESLAVIKQSIAFPGVLGRVCPRFCEGVCRRAELDEPIAICSLKRFPADVDNQAEDPLREVKKRSTGKRVIIIGAGVVGLTAAYYLLQDGHDCLVYESRERLGGALRNIVPEFRLPSEVVDTEAQRIVDLGAKIECGKALGRDFTLESTRTQADAVLLATGASRENLPKFPGSELAGSSLTLLQQLAVGNAPKVHGRVLVYGPGATALDACRALLRLGAEEATLVITPPVTARFFFTPQIGDALAEGVQIVDETEMQRVEQLPDGRLRCHLAKAGEETVVEVTAVYLSGHVETDLEWLQGLGLKTTKQGVQVDRRTYATSMEGVFAAGNIAQAGRYAVHGSAAGRLVARSISRFLDGNRAPDKEPIHVRMHQLTDAEQDLLFAPFASASRASYLRLDPMKAVKEFEEVIPGLSEDVARSEAGRCLNCDCAKKNDCQLRILSTQFDANPKAFGGERPPFEIDLTHGEVIFESGKCIRCGRCISIAEEHKVPLGLTYIGRGFRVKVGVPLNESLEAGLAEIALECAEACPTAALSRRRGGVR